jgi:hypothetical protein
VVNVTIILSALWVALMLLYQQGDVQRLYSGDFVPGETEVGEMMSPQMVWMISAITMTIPVVMIILSLTLPYSANRWANIIVAAFFFVYTVNGVRLYPSAYDRFLLIISLGVNALSIWYAWKCV